jgi:excisionase family DNA binding protein
MTKFLYTTREAKAALGCGETRLYELIHDGTLDARRWGRRVYITGDSIEAFAASLKPAITPTMTAKAEHHEDWPRRRKARPEYEEDSPDAAE